MKPEAQQVKISSIKKNPNNPRLIRDGKFERLVESVTTFPEMLDVRPIVVDEDNIVLGGNMRLEAAKHLGLKTIPVIKVEGWDDRRKKEFLIKDNNNYGEWDWDTLANEFEPDDLTEWGLDVWKPEDIDYSILEEADDLEDELNADEGNVRMAVQVEFSLKESYDECKDLMKQHRDNGSDIGAILLNALK